MRREQNRSLVNIDFVLTVAPLVAGTALVLPLIFADVSIELIKKRLSENS